MENEEGKMQKLAKKDVSEQFHATGCLNLIFFFFFQAEDGIRDLTVTGVQTCALPISMRFMTALLQEGSVGRQKLSVVRRGDGDVPATCPAWRRAPCRSPPRPAEISPGTGAAARRTWRRTARPPWRRRTLGSS